MKRIALALLLLALVAVGVLGAMLADPTHPHPSAMPWVQH